MDNNRWRAAQAAREPVVDGTTGSGLPRRLPQANLLPGSAEGDGPEALSVLSREPEEVRARLSSFVDGQEQARSGDLPGQASGTAVVAGRGPGPQRQNNNGQGRHGPATRGPVSPGSVSHGQDKAGVRRSGAKPSERLPSVSAVPRVPPNPMRAPSPLPTGWDEPWGEGWRTFRPRG